MVNNLIIGTAGHIDHGKTALIKALNGFDGDETKEEKERGITVNLSFSNLSNASSNIAFIDVPGHESLIKTMIGGAFGFDAAMLVVASNEGLKPQSKEHIAVLNLLNVKNIILVITKCDLTNALAQQKVQSEVKEFIKDYKNLSIYETFFVSIKDPSSIEELKNYLFTLNPKKHDETALFRYYIDRVFSLKGHGVIVTGSVLTGSVKLSDKLLNLDINEMFSVRSLEVHAQNKDIAFAPNRVALNLSGNNTHKLEKGQILSKKGFWRGFFEADCFVNTSISHGSELLFCVGTKQVNAKVLHLKDDFYTFKFDKKMFLQFDELFILLKEGRVIGGGRVLNPVNEPLKKEQKIALLDALKEKDFLSAFARLTNIHKHGFGLISSVQRFGLNQEDALSLAKNLNDVFVDIKNGCIYGKTAFKDVMEFVNFIILKNPNALFSSSSINLKLNWASQELIQKVLNELEAKEIIQKNGGIYTKFGADFDKLSLSLEDKIYDILKEQNITPEAPYNIYDKLDIDRTLGDLALKKLTKAKKVVRLEHNLFIEENALSNIMQNLRNIIKKEGFANITNVKANLGLSRKYALAYLEYLDNFKDITKFENDRVFV